tara:strand:+ start:6295 stop:9021 length:2727 start_codon:yes stop_codon:yes gene_type:complete
MGSGRVKIVGYAQRAFYNDGIEYRNFSDNLVGNQLASEGGLPLFTLGNFTVTTNLDPSSSINYNTGTYGQFYDLTTLNVTDEEIALLLESNGTTRLRLDETNLCNQAYFGSLTEFIRVTLEKIITTWPASIYLNPVVPLDGGYETTAFTVTNYSYDAVTNTSTFNIPYEAVVNSYGLNILQNGTIINTFNEGNSLRNLTVNYASYVVDVNNTNYEVLTFSGLTTPNSGSLYLKVYGNPFYTTGNTTNLYTKYHVRPNNIEVEKFFYGLKPFESHLLDTLNKPKYTATFKYAIESDSGIILFQTKTLAWPVTDGYNIDFNTSEYVLYVGELIDMAENSDLTKTDLMVRFLTSDSISEFDTVPRCDGTEEETAAQKVSKTLKIYGREYDDIKRYIDGIAYANTVTYDKRNNTPDIVLKNLARTLGWDLVSSVLENDMLANYLSVGRASYSGQSRGLTPIESEYEMWRRLILNSPWIWKSKGTRKAIEFLIKFIGAPSGLMEFNEHVYVAQNSLNVSLIQDAIELNNQDPDLTLYNIDSDGYPKIKADTPDMYFQKGGGWYRQTGGANASKYILGGNNPHIGAYDSGQEYINQFRGLIPNFSAVTVTGVTVQTGTTVLFSNYNLGTVNNYTGATFIDLASQGFDISDCVVIDSYIIEDPSPMAEVTPCGCDIPANDGSIQIDVSFSALTTDPCPNLYTQDPVQPDTANGEGYYTWQYTQYDYQNNASGYYTNPYINAECCSPYGIPVEYVDMDYYLLNGQYTGTTYDLIVQGVEGFNSGTICCKANFEGDVIEDCIAYATCNWRLIGQTFTQNTVQIGNHRYLVFVTPNNESRVVSYNGQNCAPPTVATPNVLDPFTNQIGVGCRITETDWNSQQGDVMRQTYLGRIKGTVGCSANFDPFTLTGVFILPPI